MEALQQTFRQQHLARAFVLVLVLCSAKTASPSITNEVLLSVSGQHAAGASLELPPKWVLIRDAADGTCMSSAGRFSACNTLLAARGSSASFTLEAASSSRGPRRCLRKRRFNNKLVQRACNAEAQWYVRVYYVDAAALALVRLLLECSLATATLETTQQQCCVSR
jgi:hypothetical protein